MKPRPFNTKQKLSKPKKNAFRLKNVFGSLVNGNALDEIVPILLPSSQIESCQKDGKHGGKLDACI